ncbi:putative 2OG-Fe(II) oxygenase [Lysobacter humi (ex Lee et al. 2017)]
MGDAQPPPAAVHAVEQIFALLRAGANESALRLATDLVRGLPTWAQAHHAHALALASTGAHAAADAAFVRARQLAPHEPSILANFAVHARRRGHFAKALECLEQRTRLAPRDAAAWIDLGHTALRAGQPLRAIEALERAVELDGTAARAWHLLGNACREAERLEAAEHAFRTCVQRDPAQWTAWINLGAVLRRAGRPDEALAVFRRVHEAGHGGAELYDAWAGALLDTGDVEGALRMATQTVQCYPAFVPGHVTLAHLAWEHLPGDAALDGFRAAARAQPANGELRAALARWLIAAGRAPEAVDEVRALRSNVDDPALVHLEADALDAAGRHHDAAPLYRSLHAGWGAARPTLLNAYARHLLRTGDAPGAASVVTRCTQVAPHNQEAWAYLATAWRLLGDPREAWLCDWERLVAVLDIGLPDMRDGLRVKLESLHRAHREPRQQSVRGGTQTAGRLLQRRDPVLAAARDHLVGAVERWLGGLPGDPAHPFLARNTRRVTVGGSWSVRLRSSGMHANHIHPEGWISSAYYVALPPSVRDATTPGEAGCIGFGEPPAELGLTLPPRRIVRPAEGRLVLFPSYLWHGTRPFHDDVARLTIAFDMTPAPYP